jgi:putative PIN family toxin of toxin-antitoxin system
VNVVFDTNVFVSAFVVPGSQSDEAYHRAIAGDFRLLTSVAILRELAGKLRDKFGWEDPAITRALKAISRVGEVLVTKPHLKIVKDDTDNRILECAQAGKADLIVTGDPHLLALKQVDRIGVVKVSTFLHTLQTRKV